MFEYGATIAQIGLGVDQVVLGAANLAFPEWHNLHYALGPGAGYRIGVKAALNFYQCQHNLRCQLGASWPRCESGLAAAGGHRHF